MRRRTLVRFAVCGSLALAGAGYFTAALAADPPKSPPALAARVLKVSDGDSLEVQLDSGTARVRLSAIDTPEYDQPYGDKSSSALKTMLPAGTPIEIEVVTQDSFKRLVAVVWRV